MAAISLISKWKYKLLTSGLKPDANADPGNQGRAAGRRTHVVHGSGAATSYTLDCADRVRTVRQYRAAGVVDNVLTYTHDADGNRTQRAAPAWQVDYTWDARGRLTQAVTPSQTVTLQYDALARRTAKENTDGQQVFSLRSTASRSWSSATARATSTTKTPPRWMNTATY